MKTRAEIGIDIQAIFDNDDNQKEIWNGYPDTEAISDEVLNEEKLLKAIVDYIERFCNG